MVLFLKVEISLCQLACIITAICDFLLWPTLKKAFFVTAVAFNKKKKFVKPGKTAAKNKKGGD